MNVPTTQSETQSRCRTLAEIDFVSLFLFLLSADDRLNGGLGRTIDRPAPPPPPLAKSAEAVDDDDDDNGGGGDGETNNIVVVVVVVVVIINKVHKC